MELESSVTDAVRANALPESVALVFRVILASASTFPTSAVPVPSVAELPICQNTLQTLPPITRTEELLAVVSVLPVLIMKTAPALP